MYGENLYYYDVNSLYPFVSLMDMPGSTCTKVDYYIGNVALDTLFGFYYCEVVSPPESYLGLLPVRGKNKLHFPVGKWKGWYFSEEIKFAASNGYKIKVLNGYSFNRVENVFTDYVTKLYEIKRSTRNPVEKTMSKSLLNNLLGRFGLNINKAEVKIVNNDQYVEIASKYPLTSEVIIDNNWRLLGYYPHVDKDICAALNIDVVKLINKYNLNEESKTMYKDVSISVSAAITAYARIHMSKLKLDILSRGGSIYYSDTDSLVTDISLSSDLVHPNKWKQIIKALLTWKQTFYFIFI